MDHSPRELVMRAGRRDPTAFATLVRAHERSALAVAFAILGDASAAGDAVQEAFIKAWQRLPELHDPDRFSGWLAQIVRNTAIDAKRRRPIPVCDVDGVTVPFKSDPAAGLERSESRQRLDAALAELEDVTRTVVALKYYDDLSSRQIGELLELSPAAVDMRLRRARTELRQKLSKANAKE